MNVADLPARFNIPFAADAGGSYIRPIPQASQIGIQNGAASLTDGFPPDTFTPVNAGGVPPFGQDMNGILNQITLWNQWQAAGGPVFYDATFASDAGGYPEGAVLASSSIPGLCWRSTADANETDPDNPAVSANWTPMGRVVLGEATTFYVNASIGSDTTGNGLTTGTAWQTIQHAVNYLSQYYDFGDFVVTLQLADGTYAGATIFDAFVGQGAAGLTIKGNTVTPANVTVGIIIAEPNSKVTLTGYTCVSSSYALFADGGAIYIGPNMVFGACTLGHINAGRRGGVFRNNSYTINGAAPFHLGVDTLGIINTATITVTLTGTPAFSGYFAKANTCGILADPTTTYSGAATGVRYNVILNGVIQANGDPNYYPGNSAGSTATGGQYA